MPSESPDHPDLNLVVVKILFPSQTHVMQALAAASVMCGVTSDVSHGQRSQLCEDQKPRHIRHNGCGGIMTKFPAGLHPHAPARAYDHPFECLITRRSINVTLLPPVLYVHALYSPHHVKSHVYLFAPASSAGSCKHLHSHWVMHTL
jgi:hypothetical protein